MIIKLSMILVLIAALFFPQLYNSNPQPLNTATGLISTNNILLFGIALKAASFTYGGYQQTINFGEEVSNPQKNLPRGIIAAFLLLLLYISALIMLTIKLSVLNELKTTRGIAAIVTEKMFGESGKYIFSILLFLAVLAYVNVLLLSNPRSYVCHEFRWNSACCF